MVAAAARLSAALGGARVTLECALGTAEADALAAEINAGLAAGGGPAWVVESLTVAAGDPPRVAAIKVTVGGDQEDQEEPS
jgi:hypothetical protein